MTTHESVPSGSNLWSMATILPPVVKSEKYYQQLQQMLF
jgi:hypothetical protein